MGSSPIGIANTVSILCDASNHIIEIAVSFYVYAECVTTR